MHIDYRPLEETETGEATDVFLTTVKDLAARNGLPAPAFTRQAMEPMYDHLRRTGIFRVAVSEGKIVAICAAIVRDGLWFLSMFWTLPPFQKQRIGRPLLQQVWDEGTAEGAKVRFTWSSIDFTAVATYMRLGMLPGGPVLTFAGPPSKAPARPTSFGLETLDARTAARIDTLVRGTPREVDHALWLASGGAAHEVWMGGQAVGYFYARNGIIGPAAWIAPEYGRAVVDLALGMARTQASDVRLMAVGENHTAIGAALDHGLKLVGTSHFLRSEAFGRMDQYLPSGPVLF
jgi:hypothetical protein